MYRQDGGPSLTRILGLLTIHQSPGFERARTNWVWERAAPELTTGQTQA